MSNLAPNMQCLSLTPDTIGLNCSSTFPRKISPGLCAGCEILRPLEGKDLERVQVRYYQMNMFILSQFRHNTSGLPSMC